MHKLWKLLYWVLLSIVAFVSVSPIYAANNRFSDELQESVSDISTHLTPPAQQIEEWWWATVAAAVIWLIDDVVIPVVIAIWILIWLIWAYKILFSSDEKEISNWVKMVAMGVIWIIIMMSAKYLGKSIVEIFKNWQIDWNSDLNWIQLATELYTKLAYPFIKIILYLALFVIFVVLLWKSISLFTKTDWTNKKTSVMMIAWSAISMLIIIWAKTIVEAIYWKQAEVLNDNSVNLWEIWTWILADKDIPLLYTILNRVVWITSLVIFILLLVQWFKILMNPGKAENFQKLWKNILYTVIWLLVIWAIYLLTNVLIVN